MANYETRQRNKAHEDDLQRTGKSRVRINDVLLILIALLLVALAVYGLVMALPSVREFFDNQRRTVYFTVELSAPIAEELMQDGVDFPFAVGDRVSISEADGVYATVEALEAYGDGSFRLTLSRVNARYMENEGYRVQDLRLAVGARITLRGEEQGAFSARISYLTDTKEEIPPVQSDDGGSTGDTESSGTESGSQELQ